MSEFQFQKTQRVIVPVDIAGAEGVQGVVTGNRAELGMDHEYRLQWLSRDAVSPGGFLKMNMGHVRETSLLAAQPPKMVLADVAQKMAAEAYDKGAADVRDEIEIERLSRIAKRKATRKASARKRSRK